MCIWDFDKPNLADCGLVEYNYVNTFTKAQSKSM